MDSRSLESVPKTVFCFLADYARIKDGSLTGYRHDEFPAKMYAMIPLYVSWFDWCRSQEKPLQDFTSGMRDEISKYRKKK